MPSFVETMKFTKMNLEDKTSAKRFREILGILRKHEAQKGLTPQKAVSILEDLGPTFMKLGQIASTHPDVLPQEYCTAFAALRAQAVPLDSEVVKQKIEEELDRPLADVFVTFEDEPLGSASIAQVHRATLHDGTKVAVKVQRPGIVKQISEDLLLMRHLLATYEFFDPQGGEIGFKSLVDEMERSSREELDFTLEMKNLLRFKRNNEGREHVHFPECFPEYTTSAVLVESFAAGPRVGDEDALEKLSEQQRGELAKRIALNYVHQVSEDGFFHADPHSGNLILADGGAGFEWIDFGMMGELSSVERAAVRDLMLAIGKQNAYDLKRALLKLATPTGPVDHGALLASCESLLDQYANADLDGFNTGSLLQDLMDNVGGVGYKFSQNLMMLGRGLVTLEGTIHDISGSVSVTGVVMEFMKSSYSLADASKRLRTLAAQSADSAAAAVSLPLKASEALDMLQKGQLNAQINLNVGKDLRIDIASALEHFALAIIVAALFVGSCVLCLSGLRPQVIGVPLIGLISFVVALAISIGIFVNMFRDNKKRKRRP